MEERRLLEAPWSRPMEERGLLEAPWWRPMEERGLLEAPWSRPTEEARLLEAPWSRPTEEARLLEAPWSRPTEEARLLEAPWSRPTEEPACCAPQLREMSFSGKSSVPKSPLVRPRGNRGARTSSTSCGNRDPTRSRPATTRAGRGRPKPDRPFDLGIRERRGA